MACLTGAHSSQVGKNSQPSRVTNITFLSLRNTNTFYTKDIVHHCHIIDPLILKDIVFNTAKGSHCIHAFMQLSVSFTNMHKEVCAQWHLWPNPHDKCRPNIYPLLRLHAPSKSACWGGVANIYVLSQAHEPDKSFGRFMSSRDCYCRRLCDWRVPLECHIIDWIKDALCAARKR